MTGPCSICGQDECEHLRSPLGPLRIRTPLDQSPEEFVEWLRRNGFPGAHIDREHPLFHQELIEVKPYPMPGRMRIFELEYHYPHYQEEPALVPSIPYVPITDENGDPFYIVRPDGTIWRSGDPW